MGNLNKIPASSGFTMYPTSKYYDNYTTTSSTTACNGGQCYGHALSETQGWYGDRANFVSSVYSWFSRGGSYDNGTDVGIFNSNLGNGDWVSSDSFRSVIIMNTNITQRKNAEEYIQPGNYIYVAPKTGTYELEVWGAQGGSVLNKYNGGYGGYSHGLVELNAGQKVYVNVGGKGADDTSGKVTPGGYNGGGSSGVNGGTTYIGSGGGATHIALLPGLLSTFMDQQDKLLIVAGGGGGADYWSSSTATQYASGGSGGGYIGSTGDSKFGHTPGTGGNQNSGGTGYSTGQFGIGASSKTTAPGGAGGGGGYYGGGSSYDNAGGGGGSGYIANSLLTNKVMYCYNCEESNEESIKTISTENVAENPISEYAKQGNGAVRIELTRSVRISIIRNINETDNTKINKEYASYNKIEENEFTNVGMVIDGFSLTRNGNIIIRNGEKITSKFIEKYGPNITLYVIWKRPDDAIYLNPGEFIYTIPISGIYQIEAWGAQGGSVLNKYNGGYGGYSHGLVELNAGQKVYVNVGGKGADDTSGKVTSGGYNGGGSSGVNGGTTYIGSGGGATHIALLPGLLSTFMDQQDKLLIVAGGGGGADYWSSSTATQYASGGAGGGYIGSTGDSKFGHTPGTGGNQNSGGTGYSTGQFGIGASSKTTAPGGAGGGGGYYGGGSSYDNAGGGGGSGYIANSLLTNKAMYCYNCEESNEESIKTISTENISENPISRNVKEGNGAVKIKYVGQPKQININFVQNTNNVDNESINKNYYQFDSNNITNNNFINKDYYLVGYSFSRDGDIVLKVGDYITDEFINKYSSSESITLYAIWTPMVVPKFTYTGSFEIVHDDDTLIYKGENETFLGTFIDDKNWKIRLLTSGTFINYDILDVDVFAVGGGAAGNNSSYHQYENEYDGGVGGGGGYTTTKLNVVMGIGEHDAVIGQGGQWYAAAGGKSSFLTVEANGGSGSSGGSGGGGGGSMYSWEAEIGIGGSNGSNGGYGNWKGNQYIGGPGQGSTTREFGESTGKLYAAGGNGGYGTASGAVWTKPEGGGGLSGSSGDPNTGGGGGGRNTNGSFGTGGSGIIVIRNSRN